MKNLFLAPGHPKNIDRSIGNAVSMRQAESVLSELQIHMLKTAHPGKFAFRCWAMSEASRHYYDMMQEGDIVIFSPRGTGLFTHRGTVAMKFESAEFGPMIWPSTPGEPWKLVYTLADVHGCRTKKAKLRDVLNYDPGYAVAGTIRVDPQRLRNAVRPYGSLDSMLSTLGC